MHAVKDTRESKGQTMVSKANSSQVSKRTLRSDITGPCPQRNFFLHGKQVVEVGGLFWALKMFLSGKLSMEMGVRVGGRIWIGLCVQVLVTGIGLFFGISYVVQWADFVDETRAIVGRHYTPQEVQNIPDRDWLTYTQDDLQVTPAEQELLDRIPERWMVEGKS